jgi:hypothetical protein
MEMNTIMIMLYRIHEQVSLCRMLSSALFHGFCSLNVNVSEHCVCSIFIGG